jgi:hypothetical protein
VSPRSSSTGRHKFIYRCAGNIGIPRAVDDRYLARILVSSRQQATDEGGIVHLLHRVRTRVGGRDLPAGEITAIACAWTLLSGCRVRGWYERVEAEVSWDLTLEDWRTFTARARLSACGRALPAD